MLFLLVLSTFVVRIPVEFRSHLIFQSSYFLKNSQRSYYLRPKEIRSQNSEVIWYLSPDKNSEVKVLDQMASAFNFNLTEVFSNLMTNGSGTCSMAFFLLWLCKYSAILSFVISEALKTSPFSFLPLYHHTMVQHTVLNLSLIHISEPTRPY